MFMDANTILTKTCNILQTHNSNRSDPSLTLSQVTHHENKKKPIEKYLDLQGPKHASVHRNSLLQAWWRGLMITNNQMKSSSSITGQGQFQLPQCIYWQWKASTILGIFVFTSWKALGQRLQLTEKETQILLHNTPYNNSISTC